MDTNRLCPSCQKPLVPDVPMGLCPECLIQAGFPTGVETDAGSPTQPAFVPPSVGEIARLFPQLEILELIGKGGMGAVYKARQKQLNRFVALKILPPGIGSEPAFAERFTREARALAQLNHPNIVTLYEFGETSGQFYFLMEFVDGVNLRQLLASSRMSPREALAIVPQICDALQFAHDQGIVHRDIKPENILLDRRGRVKVADFGLAKLVGAERSADLPIGTNPSDNPNEPIRRSAFPELTESGKIMGTPNYMAPEQVEHPGEVDHRADIYALGVVFYQMLTGELPGKKIEPPSSKVLIDVRLDEVVLRALEKRPELRYQQVSEVRTMVETIVAMNPSPLAPPVQPQPATQTMNTNTYKSFWRGAVMFVSVAACVVLAVFAILFLLKNQITLGPSDSDASSAGADWLPDWKGGGSVSVDFNDPATKGGYDFVLSNTSNFVAGVENYAVWRCPNFSLGSAAGGARPIAFSFAYKLEDPVAARNNLRVQLCFWDSTGTNFMGERDIDVGAHTGDSAMTSYRTLAINGIMAPPKAQTMYIAILANINHDLLWASGTGRFANISVTTVPHSLLFKAGVIAATLIGICALIMLLVRFWRRSAPACQSSPMAPPAQSQPSTQTMNTNSTKSFWRGAVMFAGVAACVVLAVFAIRFLLKHQMMLGPPDTGDSSAGANWITGANGGGSVSVDFNDPATKGGCDFTISNTVAGPGNNADLRCPPFPLGPAAGGARPITFSFAYKLADPVAAGNNIHVQLRFFDSTGNNFINERVFYVGARTSDSDMTGYRTVTVKGITAPRKAQMADVWVNANIYEPWVSGTGRFDNFSVTTVPHSRLFKAVVVLTALIGICALIMLLVRFWHRSAPARQSSPMAPPAQSHPSTQIMNTDTNTLKLMTWSKAKTAIVAAACLLLAAGTATVIIYNMGKSMRSIRAEWSAISGDSGQWSFENGKIKAHTVTGDSIFASREKYGDVTFSAVASTTNREASLAIRLQDANNGYLIVFAPANTPGNADGFIRLIQRTSGNNTTIATYQKRNLVTVGKSAKIKVVAKGSLITVFLNGEKILQAHDTTFTAGYIGFRIYGWGDFPCDATFSKVTF